jgi:hypothetical protein
MMYLLFTVSLCMIFPHGTKVRLRFTGETATVIAPLGDGMVQVRMDDDPTSLIPAFEEDLQEVAVYNKFAVAPKSAPKPPPLKVLKSKTPIESPKGVQLVFEPMPSKDDLVTRYKTWLLNDTLHEFLFDLHIFIEDDHILGLDGKLEAQTIYEVGDLASDDLNDSPEAELSIRRITTAGTEDELFRVLKIRPKQFFKNFDFTPIIIVPAHSFLLFGKFDPAQSKAAESQDLKDYNKQKKSQNKPTPKSNSVKYELYSVEAFATFETEIDLHIQALSAGYARLDKSEILRIQMKHFEGFMDKALRLGVPKVFIIHGIGEGKLKEEVAYRLKNMPFVRKFKNEFHHKYGYGATEVWFE